MICFFREQKRWFLIWGRFLKIQIRLGFFFERQEIVARARAVEAEMADAAERCKLCVENPEYRASNS